LVRLAATTGREHDASSRNGERPAVGTRIGGFLAGRKLVWRRDLASAAVRATSEMRDFVEEDPFLEDPWRDRLARSAAPSVVSRSP
jgi:hypothetical protein